MRKWAIASGCALVAACKHAPSAEDHTASQRADRLDAATVTVTGGTALDAGNAAPRCRTIEGGGGGATLHDLGDLRGLEVGEGIATPNGALVGIVHAPSSGREALVARLVGHEVTEEWVVAKRGELVADAPPPKPLFASGVPYAAYIARETTSEAGAGSRRIALKKSGATDPLASYPERADESLAFDAAVSTDESRAALVWDEDALKGGGITLAVATLAGGRSLTPRVVSGEAADPDAPRLVARSSGGWWVAWIVHRAEASADGGARAAASAIEAPAEERAYSWIEVVATGDDGTPIGSPRRITSALGHVASFDLAPGEGGGLRAVVRDETQGHDGEGGRILSVLVPADGNAGDPAVVVQAGVGRGSVDAIGGAWIAFSDPQDRTLLLPLEAPFAPGGGARSLVSSESALEGGRLLTLLGGGELRHFVAAFPVEGGALFREVACDP